MSDINRDIQNWLQVIKGDNPGHEFHGNQYGMGSGSGASISNSSSMLSYGDRNFPESSLSNVTAKDYSASWNQVPVTDNAAKVMECVNRYMEENPDVQDQMRNGWATPEEKTEFTMLHMDAIPKWLVQSATNDDIAALTDNNYHSAVDAIVTQRPDLVQKSVGGIKKDNYPVNYPNKLVADNLKTGGAPLKASEALMDTARAITMRHEAAALGQTKPLYQDDYLALAKQHLELAEKHQDLGRQLKAANPVAYIQAISAHGDAMGAHENAAKGMKAMAQTDEHWDGHHGELRPSYWEDANKAWGDSHRAFLIAQMAHDRTAFDTSVAKSADGEIMGWIGLAKGMNESLADVIRHDQDHDDWHAMHGDAPCTSEADCAAKRAKYAEVKAEEAASVSKGDLPGHDFHGNQYSTMPSGHGDRDFDPQQTADHIGKMNILAISGGRVGILRDGGKPKGVELPVSHGYKVRVFLHNDDTYTVQRVLARAGKETVKGEVRGIHADELGEQAYQAGMYKSNPFGGHNP